MKLFFIGAGALLLVTALPATAATVTLTQTVNAAIPDNNDTGLVAVIPFSSTDTHLTEIEVLIETSGGWNGDLYAYLEHNGQLAVLLNRPGKTINTPAGAASSGMSIRLTDSALSDIHNAISLTAGVAAVGTYQPDARATDPAIVTDESPRSRFLATFTGIDPNGLWTLFIADLSAGDTATLESWSLAITAVPEASTALLAALGSATLLLLRRRTIRP